MKLLCPGCGKVLECDQPPDGGRDLCPSCGVSVEVPPALPGMPPAPPPPLRATAAVNRGGRNAALVGVMSGLAALVALALLALLLERPESAADGPPTVGSTGGDELGGGGAEQPEEGLAAQETPSLEPFASAGEEVTAETQEAPDETPTNTPTPSVAGDFVLVASKPPVAAPVPGQASAPEGGAWPNTGAERLGTGDVSFRIYWSPMSDDVDLHVEDPSGHHLWFREPRCPCRGVLDRDDRVGGGPENIFWPTGQAPGGAYRYFAAYYEGFGPKRVTIEVRREGNVIEKQDLVLTAKGDVSATFVYTHRLSGRDPLTE